MIVQRDWKRDSSKNRSNTQKEFVLFGVCSSELVIATLLATRTVNSVRVWATCDFVLRHRVATLQAGSTKEQEQAPPQQ